MNLSITGRIFYLTWQLGWCPYIFPWFWLLMTEWGHNQAPDDWCICCFEVIIHTVILFNYRASVEPFCEGTFWFTLNIKLVMVHFRSQVDRIDLHSFVSIWVKFKWHLETTTPTFVNWTFQRGINVTGPVTGRTQSSFLFGLGGSKEEDVEGAKGWLKRSLQVPTQTCLRLWWWKYFLFFLYAICFLLFFYLCHGEIVCCMEWLWPATVWYWFK